MDESKQRSLFSLSNIIYNTLESFYAVAKASKKGNRTISINFVIVSLSEG